MILQIVTRYIKINAGLFCDENNGNFKLHKEFQHCKHVFNFGDNCLVVYNFIFLLYSSYLIGWKIEEKR